MLYKRAILVRLSKLNFKKQKADMAEALPAATMEKINARATAQFAEWKANATAEHKAVGLAKLERFKNDEAFKAEHIQKLNKAWTDADTNGDGKLDRAEFGAWAAAMRTVRAEEGDWCEAENHDDEDYEMMNSVSEGDGFT